MSSGSEFLSNVSNRHEAPAIMTGNEVSFPKPANPGNYGVIYVNNLTGEAFIYTRTGWIPFAGGGSVTGANNGLYVDNNTVKLGANPLVETTVIDLAGFFLSIGNDGNAALVLAPTTGISRLGAFGLSTNNTYITVDDTIQAIKLNVDSGGASSTKGIVLDGVNNNYKFGDSQTVALEIFGDPITGQSFKTYFNGLIYGFSADLSNNIIAVGDIDHSLSYSHTNLFIDPENNRFFFSSSANYDPMFLYGYEDMSGTYCITTLGDISTIFSDTKIEIYSGTANNLINIASASGNYKFNNLPTYASNTAALASGLVVGNIYQIGGTLGSASHLAIVY